MDRRLAAAGVGLSGVLLLAGCGGFSSEATPASTVTVTQTPTPTVTITETPTPTVTVTSKPTLDVDDEFKRTVLEETWDGLGASGQADLCDSWISQILPHEEMIATLQESMGEDIQSPYTDQELEAFFDEKCGP